MDLELPAVSTNESQQPKLAVPVESVSNNIARVAFLQELKKVSLMAGPLVVVTVSEFLLQVVSLMMVGHLHD